ncbi:CotG/ExsB N-terminal domain-containing protein, partial [Bacillus nakamurai]|uniref:CotG/ExsB N-terminal domain-containing protein n=1 Tax=Bacillus nakamurai TaxID=1793963 RepID=UPI00398F5815|nr:spore gernimation protein GerQ [Bacillus nakamurai]
MGHYSHSDIKEAVRSAKNEGLKSYLYQEPRSRKSSKKKLRRSHKRSRSHKKSFCSHKRSRSHKKSFCSHKRSRSHKKSFCSH